MTLDPLMKSPCFLVACLFVSLWSMGGCERADTSPPVTPEVVLMEDTGASAEDRITQNGVLQVVGLESSTWFYSLNGGNSWVAGEGDRFTVPEGAYKEGAILVYQRDSAGNVSTVAAVAALEVDQTVTTPQVALEDDNGPSTTDNVTTASGVTVSNLVQPFERQQGAYWEYSVDRGASWTRGTGSRFDLDPSTYAADQVQVRQVDLAGNRSETGALQAVSILAPLPPPYLTLNSDTGASGSDNRTRDGAILVGNVDPSAHWEYSYNAGISWLTGSSSLEFQAPEADYAAGAIRARQLDALGYPSDSVLLGAVVVDQSVSAPNALLANDTGASATDGITQDGQLDLTLSEAESTWEYSLDNGSVWQAGSGRTLTLPVADYPPGAFQLREVDVAGNVSEPRRFSPLRIDNATTPPILQLDDQGAESSDLLSRSGQVTVLLTDNASSWQYSLNGGASWAPGLGTEFVLRVGNYQVNQIQVKQTDLAGNVSTAASFPAAVVVETTVPTVLSVSPSDYSRVGLSTVSVQVTFSERMTPSLLTTNTTTACSGNLQVSGDLFSTCLPMSASLATSTDNQSFTVQFAESIETGVSYKVRVLQAVTDYAGNAMEADYTQTAGFMRPPAMQSAYLKPSNAETLDKFGHDVAVSGSTLAVSAPFEDGAADGTINAGAVYVFRDGATVTQDTTVLRGGTAGDFLGWSIDLDATQLAAGAPYQDPGSINNAGAVVVYEDSGSSLGSPTTLTDGSGVSGDYLGYATAISGSVVVGGAYGTGNDAGKAVAFSGASFASSNLSASPSDSDQFGYAVATDGNWVVIGVPYDDSNQTTVSTSASADDSRSDSGAVYVFKDNGTLLYYLKADNAEAGDGFGSAVAIDNGTIVVGAPREDSSATTPVTAASLTSGQSTLGSTNNTTTDSGAVYVFKDNGTSLALYAYLKPDNPGDSYFFGSAVDIDGEHIVVGAPEEGSNQTYVTASGSFSITAPGAGAVYVFKDNGTHVRQYAYLKADNANQGDKFGSSVAVDNVTVLIGAPEEDGAQTEISTEGTRDDSAPESGAAYVFRIQ